MMSLAFGLFTQVSGSGPLGPLVVDFGFQAIILTFSYKDILPLVEKYVL